jgi:hypothetical protein
MKKPLVSNIIILLAGLLIGAVFMYVITGIGSKDSNTQGEFLSIDTTQFGSAVDKTNKKVKSDKKSMERGTETNSEIEDDFSLTEDTTDINFGEEDFDIVSERMLARKNMSIQLTGPDTLGVEDLLNLRVDSYGTNIVVEFWESPLDLIGYELTYGRLKLFGFNSNDPMRISRDYNSDKLRVQMGENAGSMTLVLDKTNRFKSILLR